MDKLVKPYLIISHIFTFENQNKFNFKLANKNITFSREFGQIIVKNLCSNYDVLVSPEFSIPMIHRQKSSKVLR